MSSDPFGMLPDRASSSIKPFTIDFPKADIKNMVDLLELTPVAPASYESSLPNNDRHLGLRREWLVAAKQHWETKFDWFVSLRTLVLSNSPLRSLSAAH